MKEWADIESDINSYGQISLDHEPSETTNLKTDDKDELQKFEDIVEAYGEYSSKFWELGFYKAYFDIDTQTAIQRIKKVFHPFSKGQFFEEGAPDLYTPFWTVTTLIFILAAASNFGFFIAHGNGDSNAPRLLCAGTYIYMQAAVIPFTLYTILKGAGSKLSLLEITSLYGYSLIPFVPACVLCIYPNSLLRWTAMGLAAFWSGFLMMSNLWENIKSVMESKKYLVALLMLSGHILIVLLSNLYFFNE
ncbi:unnamed protein product [Blepharisma stoltei]|uniref:Protein YIPF n=1 Tax=Blepharisma stoltei TaxID=1481888 RepID=A0AAU9KNG3_9CILI|nr:unnamed protein product [Blepharisma stoltei]